MEELKRNILLLCIFLLSLTACSWRQEVFDKKESSTPLRSNEIRILKTTPDKEFLKSATDVKFEGIAGSEVKSIRAWKFCEGDNSDFVNIPVSKNGSWTFSYETKPMGICRGSNSINFQSNNHCRIDSYIYDCPVSKIFDFESEVGYVYPNSIILTQNPTDSLDKSTLIGIAGSDVTSINANIWCEDAGTSKTVELERTANATDEWKWELPLRPEEQTLCKGKETINLRSTTPCTRYCDFSNQKNASVELFFDDGYLPSQREKDMQKVFSLQKNNIHQVSDDVVVQTNISSSLLIDCGNIDGSNPQLPEIIVPPQKLDDRISVQLVGSGTTAKLEFLSTSTGSTEINIPKPLFHDCNAAKIYYMRPDRIIVDKGRGFESGPNIEFWDGKKWKDLPELLKNQVPIETNLDIGAVNKKYFVIKEAGYCCDITTTVVLGYWSSYVIDVDTLKIIDVIFEQKFN